MNSAYGTRSPSAITGTLGAWSSGRAVVSDMRFPPRDRASRMRVAGSRSEFLASGFLPVTVARPHRNPTGFLAPRADGRHRNGGQVHHAQRVRQTASSVSLAVAP